MLLLRKCHSNRRKREIVLLIRESGGVQLVANEGALRVRHGDVADVDAVIERVGAAIGLAAGLWIEKLVVPDERNVIGRDTRVGFDRVDEVVEPGFERGQGVLRA